MNKTAVFLCIWVTFIVACKRDDVFKDSHPEDFSHGEYTPILMLKSDLKESIKKEEAREIEVPGKIYLKHPYIFVIEQKEGVHVINNSDPYQPVNEFFITVPGIEDVAVKDSTLYVDNAVDLVAIRINSDGSITETKRIENQIAEDHTGFYSPNGNYFSIPKDYVLIKWKKQ